MSVVYACQHKYHPIQRPNVDCMQHPALSSVWEQGLGADGIETSDLDNSLQFANLIMNLDMLRAIGHGSKTIKKK